MRRTHVVNGDSVAGTLRAAFPNDAVVALSDLLFEGPISAGDDAHAARTRAAYLAAAYGVDEGETVERLRAEDAALEAAFGGEEVVLWSGSIASDQLCAARVAARFGRREQRARVSAVDGDDARRGLPHFGAMRPRDARRALAKRSERDAATLAGAASVWTAYAGDDPHRLAAIAVPSPLWRLARAVRRLLEELPSAAGGLDRTERIIVDAVARRPRKAAKLFVAHAREDVFFAIGDWSFARRQRALAEPPAPLLARGSRVRLTPLGERIAAGEADRVAACGYDRWFGGCRLHAQPGGDVAYRYDRVRGAVVTMQQPRQL